MTFDDQLERYFGTRDLSSIHPAASHAAVERMQVDLGLATDAGFRFALWCLLFTLSQAPDIDETFEVRSDRDLARQFMEKRHGAVDTIFTDGLRFYGAVLDELGNRQKQEIGRWANSWVENSHLPFRRRERAMLRFAQMKTLQKLASAHVSLHNHFATERHLVDRQTFKQSRSASLAE